MAVLSRTDQLQELIKQFGMLQKAAIKQYGEATGSLTPIMRKVVLIIGLDADVNIKHIAATLQVTSGAATQHVAALEELGYVQRQTGSQDRREVLVQLTADGHKLCAEIKRRTLEILKTMFTELDDKELAELTGLIHKVSSKYQSQGGHHDH